MIWTLPFSQQLGLEFTRNINKADSNEQINSAKTEPDQVKRKDAQVTQVFATEADPKTNIN